MQLKNRIFNSKSLNTDLAALLLRIIFGGLFLRYGYVKMASYQEILLMFGDIIGIGSNLSYNLVIFAEFFCGFLVLIGLLTRIAFIPIFITVTVAFFVVHAKDPFDIKSLSFVFLLPSTVVYVLGSGEYSVDKLIRR